MTNAVTLIILHQLLFQGMFFTKNLTLKNNLGAPVRGNNTEANLSIVFFVLFIVFAIYLAVSGGGWGRLQLLAPSVALALAVLLLLANMVVGFASLYGLGDSWRVGVIEQEHTDLIDTGIYGHTRNPYFVSYLLFFAAYIVLLQSPILLLLGLIGCRLVHSMILKEERHLESVHGESYRLQCNRVPRYLLR